MVGNNSLVTPDTSSRAHSTLTVLLVSLLFLTATARLAYIWNIPYLFTVPNTSYSPPPWLPVTVLGNGGQLWVAAVGVPSTCQ